MVAVLLEPSLLVDDEDRNAETAGDIDAMTGSSPVRTGEIGPGVDEIGGAVEPADDHGIADHEVSDGTAELRPGWMGLLGETPVFRECVGGVEDSVALKDGLLLETGPGEVELDLVRVMKAGTEGEELIGAGGIAGGDRMPGLGQVSPDGLEVAPLGMPSDATLSYACHDRHFLVDFHAHNVSLTAVVGRG